jgi:hypothetical protein
MDWAAISIQSREREREGGGGGHGDCKLSYEDCYDLRFFLLLCYRTH